LPYIWATLKTSSEQEPALSGQFEWLNPIYRNGRAEDLLAEVDPSSIDILGLSCYTWNFDLQCALAALVRRANPHCLIVAGGPQPDVKDPQFFRRHPYIDIVVKQDGEITFNKILAAIAAGDRDFASVPGLALPADDERLVYFTGAPELPTQFDVSPYIAQSAYFERLVAAHGPALLNAVWETNRGCPYSCSFCDWGSNTMSKIRRFDLDRVLHEAEWLGRMNLNFIFLADANFGILPRDVDIAREIAAARRRHGGPRYLYYSPAKNNPDRALAVARALFESGVSPTHALAIQHTDPVVLASTDRQNISAERQRDVARVLLDLGIPSDVHLILGIPGDSYERWKKCFDDLMEWGIHDDYSVFFYNLLPNAPAADPAFISRWGIQTLERRARQRSGMVKRGSQDGVIREQIIISSNSFTAEDWVQMNLYASFVRALHCGSLTRWIAIYLRRTHGISYQAFYECLIEQFLAKIFHRGRLHAEVEQTFRACLHTDTILENAELDVLPNFPYYVTVVVSIFVKLCMRCDDFFEHLNSFLCARFSQAAIRSIVDYQKNVIILPFYDARQGKSFAVKHDWIAYFEAARKDDTARLAEPKEIRGVIHASEMSCGDPPATRLLDWFTLTGDERWHTWLIRTALARQSARSCNFSSLSIASCDGLTAFGNSPAQTGNVTDEIVFGELSGSI
jgi:putative methyltransferase